MGNVFALLIPTLESCSQLGTLQVVTFHIRVVVLGESLDLIFSPSHFPLHLTREGDRPDIARPNGFGTELPLW